MLEYRRRANNKIGLGQKMKDRIGRWADGGSENNRGGALWGGLYAEGNQGCRRDWPYLTLGRTFESAVCNFTRGVAGGFLKTPFGFFIVR